MKKNSYQLELQFKTAYNAMDFPDTGEVNKEPSLTIPDQTMSIREIMERFAKGLPIGGAKAEIWDDDEQDDLPDLSHMDLAEREEAILNLGLELEDIKDRLQPVFNSNPHLHAEFRNPDWVPDAPAPEYPKKTPPEGPPAGPPEAKEAKLGG